MKSHILLARHLILTLLIGVLFPAGLYADIVLSEISGETDYSLTDAQIARMAVIELTGNQDPELEEAILFVFEE